MAYRYLLFCGCCLLGWMSLGRDVHASKIDEVIAELNLQLPSLEEPPKDQKVVQRRLKEWQKWWRQGQIGLVKQGLKDLELLQLNLGITNFVTLSQFLVQRGDLFAKKGKLKEARFYYQKAIVFSPELSEPRLRLAFLNLKENPTSVVETAKLWWKGVRLQANDLYEITIFSVQLGYIVVLVIFLSFALFWSVLLVRHLRPFLHDFQDLFPQGVSPFQIELLSIFLLFIPPLMGGSVLETLIFWSLISWFYLTRTERVLTTVGFLALSGLVLFVGYLDQKVELSKAPVRWLYMLNETDLRYEASQKVEEHLKKHPRAFDYLWSMGLYHKRIGDYKQARVYFERALKVRRHAGIIVNLGNLDFIEGEGGGAYKKYQRALKINPRTSEAHYNLSLLFKHSQSTSVVQHQVDSLEAARFGARVRVERFQKQSQAQGNRYLMDVSLPRSRYWSYFDSLSGKGYLLEHLWPQISNWIPVWAAPWTGLGVIVLLWILFPVGRLHFHGKSCGKCGDIISVRHDPDHDHEELCPQCVHLFVRKESVAARRRVEKEIAIGRYQRWRHRFRIFLGACCMGSGQILVGRTIKGFFLLSFMALIAGITLGRSSLLSHPFQIGEAASWWGVGGLGVIGLLLYIHSLREVIAD